MKNAKRDVTLDEKDSIADMIQTERNLFYSFARALFFAEKKETRETLQRGMERAAQNVFLLQDELKERGYAPERCEIGKGEKADIS